MIASLANICASNSLDAKFVSDVLACYFDHTTYLKEVSLIHSPADRIRTRPEKRTVTAVGRFEIGRSCYIQDTGHFNAVEFNICFNQLAYVAYAHCFATDFFGQAMPEWGNRLELLTSDTFATQQLSSMLIVKMSSAFKKEIRSKFFGKLEIGKMRSKGDAFFSRNHISFCDDEGGFSEGDVTLAFVPNH